MSIRRPFEEIACTKKTDAVMVTKRCVLVEARMADIIRVTLM